METALYYTLSTIAQTLAGALAILVAVVLFKIFSLNRPIDDAKDALRSHGLDPARYWPVLRDQGFETMADLAKADYSGTEQVRNSIDLRRECPAAHAAYRGWGRINSRLHTALAATILDIAVCLVALSCVPRLVGSGWATQVIWSTVGFSIVCLLLYVWLIAAMVKRPAD